jgi:regulatory protein
MLSRRDYSRHEIAQKLKTKGFETNEIQTVITQMAEEGLINEQRFTESYIHWRRQKGLGPLRIAQELQARGIDADMIAEQLEITDNAWFAQARKVWLKHFKGKIPSDFRLRAKQMRFLQYRGFTREQIESVFTDGNCIEA